jgi:hypothetical protein
MVIDFIYLYVFSYCWSVFIDLFWSFMASMESYLQEKWRILLYYSNIKIDKSVECSSINFCNIIFILLLNFINIPWCCWTDQCEGWQISHRQNFVLCTIRNRTLNYAYLGDLSRPSYFFQQNLVRILTLLMELTQGKRLFGQSDSFEWIEMSFFPLFCSLLMKIFLF